MPTSNFDTASTVIKIVSRIKPASVMDVGIGFGKYGFLLREYLDVGKLSKGFSGDLADNFVTKIDGIEIDPRYIGEIQRKIYDKIYVGDGLKVIDELGHYDVVLLLDVIEHFTKEEGRILLDKIYKKTTKAIVIATPSFDYKQDAIFDNENEKHKSFWQINDFNGFANVQYKILGGNEILLVVISKDGSCPRIPTLRDEWSGRYLLLELRDILGAICLKLIKKLTKR